MAEEKIGDFMVRIGALTPAQVEDILSRQEHEEPRKLFGILAVELGYLNDKALHKYISEEEKKKQKLAGS